VRPWRTGVAASSVALLAVLSSRIGAQDDKPRVPLDDVHPRAPSTPLKIDLGPWWCPVCARDGTIKNEPRPVGMMHKSAEEVAKQVGLPDGTWVAIETPHFKILSTLGGTTARYSDSVFARFDLERLKTITPKFSFGPEGAKLDAHQRLHLYHVRLERQYAHFSALTGNTQPNLGMSLPYEVYLFADYSHHHSFCDRYIGGRADKNGVQWHVRDPPNFILFSTAESIVNDQVGRGDGPLANHVFHNVAHCLIDGYNNYYRETPAWIEEGLGHYYERRENPRFNNFCWAEGKTPTQFVKPDWETTIFSIVRRGRDSPFPQWCEKLQPGELTDVENGFSWGVVKWLVETEPLRFTKMIEPMDDQKRNLSAAELIQEGFGVSPSVLYQRWREYVLASWSGR